MLNQQIAEFELRLQRDRTVSRLRSEALLKGVRDSFTSPLALLIAAGTGFAAHRFDLLHRPKPDAATAARPSAPDSLLDGMIRSFTLAASLVALLPDSPPSRPGEVAPDAQA